MRLGRRHLEAAGLVGARGVGAIESWIPLFSFVILFGLSMDYHVFAVFATLSMTVSKQLDVGLAVAILLDATVVRGVLPPSVLSVLGDRTWWLPRWLSFLPDPTLEVPVEPSPTIETTAARS